MYKNGFILMNIRGISYVSEYKENMTGQLSIPTQMLYDSEQIYKYELGKIGALCLKHRDEYTRINQWCYDRRIEDQLLDRIVLCNKQGIGAPLYTIYPRARKDIAGLGPIHYGVEIQKRILFPVAAVEQIYAIAMSHFYEKA